MENLEIKNKNIFLNLSDGEEIVYVAEKNKGEFYSFALMHFLAVLFFSFFILISFFITMKSLWLLYTVWVISISFFYLYIRDYFFTEVILTNNRLILSRFNKLTFIDFKQIKNIWTLPIATNVPIATNISIQPKKRYRIYFISEQNLRNNLKNVFPENSFTGITFTWKAPWWQWALSIIFIMCMIFIAIHFHLVH